MVLVIVLMLLASTAALALVSLAVPFLRVFVLPCALLLPLLCGCVVLLHRSHVQSATVGVLAALLALVAWISTTPEVSAIPGVDAAIAVTYSLLVMLTAFLWSWWSTGLMAAAVLVAQTIAVQLYPTARTVSGIALLSFLTTAAVVALFARSFHIALAEARAQTRAAQAAQAETAAREAALAGKMGELAASNAQIQTLYDVVQDLETPVIPLLDGTLVVPIVGHLDLQRTTRLQQTILQAVHTHRARVLIVDLTGLVQPDTQVLEQLIVLARGVQLLGTRLILTGIGTTVAQVMVQQNITLPEIQTLRSLNEAVREVLKTQPSLHMAGHHA